VVAVTVATGDIQEKNTAAVMVTAELPPFAKPGQKIDVTVSSLSKAGSLRGGALLITQLVGPDNETYAMAQGNLAVGGLGVSGANGSKTTVNVPTAGRIPGGASVERTVATPFESMPALLLNLNTPDFTTALRLTQAIAAIRESFEELGVLLATHPDGRMADMNDIQSFDRLQALAPQIQARGMQLAADQVFVLAHWVTDRDLKRRFDVPFLVARMPEGQTPVADDKEQFEPLWIRPQDALQRHRDNDFFIIFPTIRTLERMQAFDTVDAVLAACANEQPWFHSCPRAGWLNGQETRYMEHEQPFGELALTCRDGQILHSLDWQTDTPVRLLAHVQRLTAPNPGMMTGPGTNSYVIGDADSGFIVIDPGPPDREHIQRLWQACGGDVRFIVCTHSHPDHSPGAALLKKLCAEHGVHVRIMGMASADTARAHSRFVPDHPLNDGDMLVLHSGEDTHTLRVVHTPGHAANHLCIILEEDG
jgi:8-oxo-dGTP pyrophosphatase MutT (NUDIX family)